MNRKKRGETFVEFLTALIVFGIAAAGVFSFIANNTVMLYKIEMKDTFSFEAQYWLNAPENNKPEKHNDVVFIKKGEILKVLRGSQSMDFKIAL